MIPAAVLEGWTTQACFGQQHKVVAALHRDARVRLANMRAKMGFCESFRLADAHEISIIAIR
jgi:hypothetical protein